MVIGPIVRAINYTVQDWNWRNETRKIVWGDVAAMWPTRLVIQLERQEIINSASWYKISRPIQYIVFGMRPLLLARMAKTWITDRRRVRDAAIWEHQYITTTRVVLGWRFHFGAFLWQPALLAANNWLLKLSRLQPTLTAGCLQRWLLSWQCQHPVVGCWLLAAVLLHGLLEGRASKTGLHISWYISRDRHSLFIWLFILTQPPYHVHLGHAYTRTGCLLT